MWMPAALQTGPGTPMAPLPAANQSHNTTTASVRHSNQTAASNATTSNTTARHNTSTRHLVVGHCESRLLSAPMCRS